MSPGNSIFSIMGFNQTQREWWERVREGVLQMETKGTAGDLPPLVQALLRPEAYPHPVQEITLRQTHVSYLLFTGEWVYKVKKPVNLGFLDFTTLEKRHRCCRQEVVLNRRISPQVYLGVVPISRIGERFEVEGEGKPVEYAVKMVQLSAPHALDRLLRVGRVSSGEIHDVAAKVAEFHSKAEKSPSISRLGNRAVVRQNSEENFQQIQRYVGVCLSREQCDDLCAYCRAFLEVRAEVFERRVREGRILKGHGDLHAANVFLDHGIQIIDCIEFNDRFACLDPAEEIAFLAMDLDYHGRADLSEVFVSSYQEKSGDRGIRELLDFFKVYMACVRGKVDSFCLDDPHLPAVERARLESAAQDYFRLAHSYTRDISSRPGIVLVAGLMGTGKTHLSRELANRWGMTHISSDVIRKRLARPKEHRSHSQGYQQGIYSPEFSRLTYDTLLEEVATPLKKGHPVVLDASFKLRRERRRVYRLARELAVPVRVVECVAGEDEIQRRLYRRAEGMEETVSDGRWELFPLQKADWEPIREGPDRIRLDTSDSAENSMGRLLEWLFARAMAPGSQPPQVTRDTHLQ